MKKIINKLGILEKIEIVSAIVYLSTWLLFSLFVGIGIAAAILCLLTLIFTILLFVFMKYHVYRKDKILMTLFSIYCKSYIYTAIYVITLDLRGKDFIFIASIVVMVIYAILAYFYGKKYNQMLNAFMYICMVVFVRVMMLFPCFIK